MQQPQPASGLLLSHTATASPEAGMSLLLLLLAAPQET
jgi:hypothetical protein